MNLSFNLNVLDKGSKCMLYTIQFEDEPVSGFDKFADDKLIKAIQPDYHFILSRLADMPSLLGINMRYFRHERGEKVWALPGVEELEHPKEIDQLRLACILWNDRTLIVGGGGIKPAGISAWQDIPELDDIAKRLEYAEKQIEKYITVKKKYRDDPVAIPGFRGLIRNTPLDNLTFAK